VLGASDLESQLAAIDYGVSLLEARLAAAREYAAARGKLYGTLGVLAGLGIAVLIA
jgi:stage III sporulation protein AB